MCVDFFFFLLVLLLSVKYCCKLKIKVKEVSSSQVLQCSSTVCWQFFSKPMHWNTYCALEKWFRVLQCDLIFCSKSPASAHFSHSPFFPLFSDRVYHFWIRKTALCSSYSLHQYSSGYWVWQCVKVCMWVCILTCRASVIRQCSLNYSHVHQTTVSAESGRK